MPEYRLRITLAEHGYDLANGEKMLDGFMATHPEVGPSVSQDTASGTLSITFSLEADDAQHAYERGGPIFSAGAGASGLAPTPAVNLEISLIQAEDVAAEPEPLPV